MTGFGWFLIAYWVANILTGIWLIGKPRKPYTAAEITFVAIWYVALILATLQWGTKP